MKIDRLSPEIFWENFATLFDESSKKKNWKNAFANRPKATKLITRLLHDDVSARFGCHPGKEYWPKVDVSFFDRETEDWDEWSYEVAVEHEYQADAWTDELRKLMLVNCGLKVVIGYSKSMDSFQRIVDDFRRIYLSRKYWTAQDQWLIINGPARSSSESWYFTATKFDGQSLVDITGEHRLSWK